MLQKLRSELKADSIDCFYIGSGDAHLSEYIPESEGRRQAVSQFTGSAGTCLVTQNKALLWTDGRYFLQASEQLSSDWTLMKAGNKGVPDIPTWIGDNLAKNSTVGVDANLISAKEAGDLEKFLKGKSITLKPVSGNPVDRIWADRPPAPSNPVTVQATAHAGTSHFKKISDLQAAIKEAKATACVISMLDEICWLFNLRGSDVDYNPVFYAYAVVTLESATLFVDETKLNAAVRAHLGAEVAVEAYSSVGQFLKNTSSKGKVLADHTTLNWGLHSILGEAVVNSMSPVVLPKALKSESEEAGMRACQVRDGAALTAFLCWLEQSVTSGQTVTEFEAAQKLEEFRGKMDMHVSPSFATIAGYGPNGAIIHYKPEIGTSAVIGTDAPFLLDSGAQYLDGTTDTTRTVHFGTPSPRMKQCNTMVLKGHIALAKAVFPEETLGSRLDALARVPLWRLGLDYNHGTGHGVGAFLNVHEGPQGIGFRKRDNEQGFRAGMTVSNEPGYYEDGNFGFRIENICFCREENTQNNFGGKRFLGFDTITWVPMTTKLVSAELLDDDELAWLNSYNAEVRATISQVVEKHFPEASNYLQRETEPLRRI
jgi:Xaa-Pro aminopeptidase